MGRKTMLRVANAVSDGVDPADWPRLKSKENLLLLKSPRFSRFETKEKIRERERAPTELILVVMTCELRSPGLYLV